MDLTSIREAVEDSIDAQAYDMASAVAGDVDLEHAIRMAIEAESRAMAREIVSGIESRIEELVSARVNERNREAMESFDTALSFLSATYDTLQRIRGLLS